MKSVHVKCRRGVEMWRRDGGRGEGYLIRHDTVTCLLSADRLSTIPIPRFTLWNIPKLYAAFWNLHIHDYTKRKLGFLNAANFVLCWILPYGSYDVYNKLVWYILFPAPKWIVNYWPAYIITMKIAQSGFAIRHYSHSCPATSGKLINKRSFNTQVKYQGNGK